MSEPYNIIQRWEAHFNAGDSEAVARLYTRDAVLWGTLSQDMTATASDMSAYFAAAAGLGLTVKLGDYIAQPLADGVVAIAGHYDLFSTLDSHATLFPARYSFVLKRQTDGEWLIAQHHSSPKPEAGAQFVR